MVDRLAVVAEVVAEVAAQVRAMVPAPASVHEVVAGIIASVQEGVKQYCSSLPLPPLSPPARFWCHLVYPGSAC